MSWLHRWRHRRQLQRMQLLVLDVDGVLTDGGLWFDALEQPVAICYGHARQFRAHAGARRRERAREALKRR